MLKSQAADDLLTTKDAVGLAELVRSREITSREIVEAMIDRTERLDGPLNSVVMRFFGDAIEAAGKPLGSGPLAGVPIYVKDAQTAWANRKMTQGSYVLEDNVAKVDSELVTRLIAAGMMIAGRTNSAEFGAMFETAPPLYGATRNPWNIAHSAGGSSGGAAAAVAARLLPIGHAGDGAGSIRVPAGFCGVFGLKPTRGRIPMGPDVLESPGGTTTSGFITVSVRDNAALLDAVSDNWLGAPSLAPPLDKPLLDKIDRPPGKLRIALIRKPLADIAVDPELLQAVDDVAGLCGALGHEVVEDELPIDNPTVLEAVWLHWAVSIGTAIHRIDKRKGKPGNIMRAGRFVQLLWEKSRAVPASDYLANLNYLQQTCAAVSVWMHQKQYDMWLSPLAAGLPPQLGWLDAETTDPETVYIRQRDFFSYTPLINHLGTPSMSVPLNWSSAGLPIGAHFSGRFGDEETLLRLARQLEIARPWAGRLPPGATA
ncbi:MULTISPECIES: amidase family protein [unclassified Rhizobium]|uniref:amidase n=1 Tax=unclassified Rhizobium TaxID=2613769 RepID=UPI00161C2E71|nr:MULTISPECIES: amidase family protein [unclassified Rhizobium]MBB3289030.1 Asp-tRNA(Asn)/Glu-tRNA(Gln) amidotransferase A subunit family amidase [Rhizobium sp. BK252]MBB3403772.1 Asp-tRNA(Asn)/Glu-tRNA(Gln) amidotransferase A subunit family amidase [Rhizobium sp. BK289]MBB3416559.1 Asp-tRNA(Asn)/Glu-tRNA(Gln) amidotransferase A subunit family amidase [Rhizobium sp. BK284]MBB3484235.1 Asp-tRNA(Asn)/Glu-tRNA(Gln) amidotransferase A subunit family amidase [Rhizobium sp. BK347]